MGAIYPFKMDSDLSKTCFVFKHSTRCPISFTAAEQVRLAERSYPVYWINVVEEREHSNWFAKQYGVRHESPQLVKLVDGKVVSQWSHGSIRRELLEASSN